MLCVRPIPFAFFRVDQLKISGGSTEISPQPSDIIYTKFSGFIGERFVNDLKKISLIQIVKLFKYSIPIFQNYAEEWLGPIDL